MMDLAKHAPATDHARIDAAIRPARHLLAMLRRAWAARAGSLTTITAFSAIPMIGFIGLSVDYGMELAASRSSIMPPTRR